MAIKKVCLMIRGSVLNDENVQENIQPQEAAQLKKIMWSLWELNESIHPGQSVPQGCPENGALRCCWLNYRWPPIQCSFIFPAAAGFRALRVSIYNVIMLYVHTVETSLQRFTDRRSQHTSELVCIFSTFLCLVLFSGCFFWWMEPLRPLYSGLFNDVEYGFDAMGS